MRNCSVFLDSVSTLNNLAPSCFFEKFPLGHHSLCAGTLTDGDFDHRRSRGETRSIIDRKRLDLVFRHRERAHQRAYPLPQPAAKDSTVLLIFGCV